MGLLDPTVRILESVVDCLGDHLPLNTSTQPDALDELTEILDGRRRVVRSIGYIRELLPHPPLIFWFTPAE